MRGRVNGEAEGLRAFKRPRAFSAKDDEVIDDDSQHVYEVRPRKDKRGFDLISDVLPFGRLWYAEPDAISNVVNYAKFFSRSHHAVIRVYDEAGNVIETHQHTGNFRETFLD